MLATVGAKRGTIAGRALRAICGAASVWLIVSLAVFAFPEADPPAPTDAVYYLASSGGWAGLAHVHDYGSRAIVVSRPARVAEDPRYRICNYHTITCLQPVPETTQGECEAFAAEAERRGWHSVTVVSQTSHVARVRLLMKRCFAGTIRVVAEPTEHGLYWLYAFGYESLAMIKAALTPGCHDHLPWAK